MEKEKSELITWSNKFSCGIKLLDEQHKGLVALVNELFNHVTGDEKQEYDYFNRVIGEAVKYVKIHFATEEKMMLAANLPDYATHKKAHVHFILTVAEKINNYNTAKRFNLFTFTKFLKDWILSHIALTDKQCFEQITNHNAEQQAISSSSSRPNS